MFSRFNPYPYDQHNSRCNCMYLHNEDECKVLKLDTNKDKQGYLEYWNGKYKRQQKRKEILERREHNKKVTRDYRLK